MKPQLWFELTLPAGPLRRCRSWFRRRCWSRRWWAAARSVWPSGSSSRRTPSSRPSSSLASLPSSLLLTTLTSVETGASWLIAWLVWVVLNCFREVLARPWSLLNVFKWFVRSWLLLNVLDCFWLLLNVIDHSWKFFIVFGCYSTFLIVFGWF